MTLTVILVLKSNCEDLKMSIKLEVTSAAKYINLVWPFPLSVPPPTLLLLCSCSARWDKQELHRYDLLEFLTGQQLIHHCLQTPSLASSPRLLWPECLTSLSVESVPPAPGSLWLMDPFQQAPFPAAQQERWVVQTLFW